MLKVFEWFECCGGECSSSMLARRRGFRHASGIAYPPIPCRAPQRQPCGAAKKKRKRRNAESSALTLGRRRLGVGGRVGGVGADDARRPADVGALARRLGSARVQLFGVVAARRGPREGDDGSNNALGFRRRRAALQDELALLAPLPIAAPCPLSPPPSFSHQVFQPALAVLPAALRLVAAPDPDWGVKKEQRRVVGQKGRVGRRLIKVD